MQEAVTLAISPRPVIGEFQVHWIAHNVSKPEIVAISNLDHAGMLELAAHLRHLSDYVYEVAKKVTEHAS